MNLRSTLGLATIAALAGCAAPGDPFPSLALRPIETQGFDEPAAAEPAPVAPDPALDATIATAVARLEELDRSFAGQADAAERMVRAAKGQPAGSERWIEAQTALAGLDDLRAQVSATVTDLDELAIQRGMTLAPAYPALDAARTRAQASLDRQSTRIADLTGALAPA